MGTEGGGERCRPEQSIVWLDPGELSTADESATKNGDEGSTLQNDRIDMDFEWFQLYHACGEQKWFRAMICDDCRWRHGISRW